MPASGQAAAWPVPIVNTHVAAYSVEWHAVFSSAGAAYAVCPLLGHHFVLRLAVRGQIAYPAPAEEKTACPSTEYPATCVFTMWPVHQVESHNAIGLSNCLLAMQLACQIACLQRKWPKWQLDQRNIHPSACSQCDLFVFESIYYCELQHFLTTVAQWSSPLLGPPVVPSSNPTWGNYFCSFVISLKVNSSILQIIEHLD